MTLMLSVGAFQITVKDWGARVQGKISLEL